MKSTNHAAAAAQRQAVASQAQVEVSQRQVETAKAGLAGQIRPVLADVPIDFAIEERYPAGGSAWGIIHRGEIGVSADEESGHGSLTVPFRNVGAGLAMLRGASLSLADPQGGKAVGPDPWTHVSRLNVPPGETTRVSFRISAGEQLWEAFLFAVGSYGNLSVALTYSNLAGGEMTITRLDIDVALGESAAVRSVYLSSHDHPDEPYAAASG